MFETTTRKNGCFFHCHVGFGGGYFRGFLPFPGEHCTVTLTNDRHQGQQNKFGPGSFCSNAPAHIWDICGVATVQMTDISRREVQGAKHTAGQNDGHSSCSRSLDDSGKEPARRSDNNLRVEKRLKKSEKLQFQKHILALNDELYLDKYPGTNSIIVKPKFQFLGCKD